MIEPDVLRLADDGCPHHDDPPAGADTLTTGPAMRIELAGCEATLLAEIADPQMKRADVASTYGLAILSSEQARGLIDWKKVNAAICKRWSMHALLWIKAEAWKRVEAKRKANA